jgi:hypothetical protein
LAGGGSPAAMAGGDFWRRRGEWRAAGTDAGTAGLGSAGSARGRQSSPESKGAARWRLAGGRKTRGSGESARKARAAADFDGEEKKEKTIRFL